MEYNPFRRYDLWDKFDHYKLLPIRELAELLQIAPQLVYYRIRNKKLFKETCPTCGTEGLISLDQAKEVFSALDKIKAEAESAEATREGMAT